MVFKICFLQRLILCKAQVRHFEGRSFREFSSLARSSGVFGGVM